MPVRVGVVGVQGDVSEHKEAFRQAGETFGFEVETVTVRDSGIVPDCDVIALPGGESTTISSLVRREGIDEEIRDAVDSGKPILATCAGLIVLGNPGDDRVDSLGLLDVKVKRNAFGGQRESFEANVDIKGLDKPFHAVFIRAPVVSETGEDVEELSNFRGDTVAVRQKNVVGTAFHPELTEDYRIHELLLRGYND